MSRPIFLSYRRSDSAMATGRLYDAITHRFGSESVYMDSASTAWGEEWPAALERAIADAAVIIVVVGPSWLRAADEWGRRRIDQVDDWVRREIEFSLELRKAILPLLIGDAAMPPREALPTEIAELATKQALSVDEAAWDERVERVLANLALRVSPDVRAPGEGEPSAARATIRDQFQTVAARFYTAPVDERIAAAEAIAGIGGLLELDDVLAFAASPTPAERVGAAIALAAHLRTSERPRDDVRVQRTLRDLLNDPRSRVRYRAAEVLRGFPALVRDYESDLRWRAQNDENSYVRTMASKALSRAGL